MKRKSSHKNNSIPSPHNPILGIHRYNKHSFKIRLASTILTVLVGINTIPLNGLALKNVQASEANNTLANSIYGEYVVITNTSLNSEDVESTGNIIFDDGTLTTSTNSQNNANLYNSTEIQSTINTQFYTDTPSSIITQNYTYIQSTINTQITMGLQSNLSSSEKSSNTAISGNSTNMATSETSATTAAKTALYSTNGTTTSYTLNQSMVLGSKTYQCIGIGENCYVWMDSSMKTAYDSGNKTSDIANEVIDVYEGRPYEVLNGIADGNIPYGDNSGKLSILLENTGSSSGYYAGETEITAIHINTPTADSYRAGSMENKNGLLVHEGQHALFHRLTCGGDRTLAYNMSWLNEGLSVAAMDYCWGGSDPSGWLAQINGSESIRNGFSLLYSDYRSNVVKDYSLPYLFVRYIANRAAGQYNPVEFIKSIYKVSAVNKTSEQYINEVLNYNKLTGTSGQLTFKEAVSDFYVAAFSQQSSGKYGFMSDSTVWRVVKDYPIYLGKSGESVSLEGASSIVVKTVNGVFNIPSNAGNNITFQVASKQKDLFKPLVGDGTKNNPYIITNNNQLQALGEYGEAYFKLGANLNLENYIHNSVTEFAGKLDGNGFTITGLRTPLITTVKVNAVISNLKIIADFSNEYSNTVGVIACYNNGTIADCQVGGTFSPKMKGSNFLFYPVWGTVVGSNEFSGQITRCSSDATINISLPSNNSIVGGLAGIEIGKITNCYTAGSININKTGSGNYYLYLGGIAGKIKAYAWGTSVTNSYSVTNINGATSSLTGDVLVGRAIGKIENTPTITGVYGLSGINVSGDGSTISNNDYSKSDAEMKLQDTYSGYSFGGIWKTSNLSEEVDSYSYPVFVTTEDITEVTGSFSNSIYYIGQRLILSGGNININGQYNVDISSDMVDLRTYDSSTVGKKNISCCYKGVEFIIPVTIIEPSQVEELAINSSGKTDYIEGQEYDDSSVVLTAKLNGNPYITYIYSGFESNVDMTNKTVEYIYCGKTVSQNLTVNSKTATGLQVVKSPNKFSYAAGETIDLAGLRARILYNDNTYSEVFDENELAKYNINIAKYQNSEFTKLDLEYNVTIEDSDSVIYLYVGDSLPNEGNSAYDIATKLSVTNNMQLSNQTVVLTKGLESFGYTDSIIGGSGDYSTTKLSGTLPAGVACDIYPGKYGSDYFQYSGTPTSLGSSDVIYRITDNVTGQTIDVTITIKVRDISSECNITGMTLLKGFNPALNKDYSGTIKENTVEFILPTGTDISALCINRELSDGATTESNRYNGVKFNFNTTNPVQYVITAEDGVTTKTYNISVVLKDEEPTTEQPTTQEPTTEQPTTQEPTTEQPTTEEPTTEEPTTEEPTTEEPTTQEPTTEEPTTEQPDNEYKVLIPTGEGFKINALDSVSIKNGQSFRFTLAISEGYSKVSNFSVRANGISLNTDSNGIYSIKNISTNNKITIEGIKRNINSNMEVKLSKTVVLYTGSAIEVPISVVDSFTGKALWNGRDYKVVYSNNLEVGKASVQVSGIGKDYTGTVLLNFTIFPAKVENFKADNITTNYIQLSWDKVIGTVDGYKVYEYSEEKNDYVELAAINSQAILNYKVTGLNENTLYKFKIRGYKIIGKTIYYGQGSEILSLKTKELPKYKVTLPSTSAFKIYKTVDSSYLTKEGGSFKFTLTPNLNYQKTSSLSVRANGNLIKPSAVGVYTISNIKVNTAVTVSGINRLITKNMKVSLAYTTCYYSGYSKKPSVTIKNKLNNSYLQINKDFKVSYLSNVNVGKGQVLITGIGKYTGSLSKTFSIKPGKVKGLTTLLNKSTQIKLSWKKANGNVTGYQIQKFNNNTGSYQTIKTIVGSYITTYTNSGLKSSTTCKYRIRAYKKISNYIVYYGEPSDVLTTTTAPGQTNIRCGTSNNKANILWSKVRGADGYEVSYKASLYGLVIKIGQYNSNITSCVKSGLESGKTYYFCVKAFRIVNNVKVYSGYTWKKVVIK